MLGKIKEFLKIDNMMDNVGHYIEVRIELLKLEFIESLSKFLALAGLGLGAALAGSLALIMLNLAAAMAISEAIGKKWAGPLIIGVLWLIVLIVCIVVMTNEKVIENLRSKILAELLKKEQENSTELLSDSEKINEV